MKKIIIAGGTGFLGMNLANHLAYDDCEVILLSRKSPTITSNHKHIKWDARSIDPIWVDALENCHAVVNLAGRTVDCIKTPDNCDQILRSRVESTIVLGKAIQLLKNPPKVWVQMSTAHIYGDPPTAICSEDSAFGYGLAPSVGIAWEKAFNESVIPNIRKVIFR